MKPIIASVRRRRIYFPNTLTTMLLTMKPKKQHHCYTVIPILATITWNFVSMTCLSIFKITLRLKKYLLEAGTVKGNSQRNTCHILRAACATYKFTLLSGKIICQTDLHSGWSVMSSFTEWFLRSFVTLHMQIPFDTLWFDRHFQEKSLGSPFENVELGFFCIKYNKQGKEQSILQEKVSPELIDYCYNLEKWLLIEQYKTLSVVCVRSIYSFRSWIRRKMSSSTFHCIVRSNKRM